MNGFAIGLWSGSLKSALVRADQGTLDISRGTGGDLGKPFAPSWALLKPALAGMRQGGATADRAWAWYVPRFNEEMRVSQGRYPEAWANAEEQARTASLILACHCVPNTPGERCHRYLVAKLLVIRGSLYLGEVPNQRRRI